MVAVDAVVDAVVVVIVTRVDGVTVVVSTVVDVETGAEKVLELLLKETLRIDSFLVFSQSFKMSVWGYVKASSKCFDGPLDRDLWELHCWRHSRSTC